MSPAEERHHPMSNPTQAPPGWYIDPQNPYQERYWSGTAWSEQARPRDVGGVPAGTYYPPPLPGVVPKNPAESLLLMFVPGLGSLVNGDVGPGLGIMIGFAISGLLTLVMIGFVGLIVFWIWGMVDALRGAQRWNARHGLIS
jgi:hypothetical protein